MEENCTPDGRASATPLKGCTDAASLNNHACAAPLDDRARVVPTIDIDKYLAAMEDAYDPSKHRLNLAVSNLMKFSNEINEQLDIARPSDLSHAMNCLAIMLHPLTPHASLGGKSGTIEQPLRWPSTDAKAQLRLLRCIQ